MTISPSHVHFWKPSAWLRAAGADTSAFLQGQFSGDLRELDQAPAVYGLWLNQKGRVLADSFILRGRAPDEFWVGSYFSPAGVIRERLESHIIADDVAITDATAEWNGATLTGPDAADRSRPLGDGFIFPGRRGWNGALEYVAPAMPQITDRPVLSAEDMERARIHAGIAAVPIDIGPAELPNEGGLEAVAVSYTKGCYLGQEVMARLKSMGQVRRQLLRVSGSGIPPSRPAKLYQGSRAVGELRSAARDKGGFIGLALLTLLHLRREAGLSLAPDAPPGLKLADAP